MKERVQTQYFSAPAKKGYQKGTKKGKSGFEAKIVKNSQNAKFRKNSDISYPFYPFYPF